MVGAGLAASVDPPGPEPRRAVVLLAGPRQLLRSSSRPSSGLVQQQADQIFSGPALMALLPGVERALAIVLHLSLSVLVLQCFVRGQRRWWLFAVLWHALANAVALVTLTLVNAYAAEAALAVVVLFSLLIIRRLRPEPAPPAPPAADSAAPEPPPVRPEVTGDKLDDSRYL